MFGIKFIKVQPTTYLLQYRGGKIVREGLGLSFFYYAPTTSLVAVPVASTDMPFIFQETTADFQTVTIQGQVTYRVGEPKRLAALLNYTLAPERPDVCLGRPGEAARAGHPRHQRARAGRTPEAPAARSHPRFGRTGPGGEGRAGCGARKSLPSVWKCLGFRSWPSSQRPRPRGRLKPRPARSCSAKRMRPSMPGATRPWSRSARSRKTS